MTNKLTVKYALVQGAYWMAYCSVHAYAAVYLLDKGFGNGQIGLLLAGANILAVILQPLVGGFLDTAKNINVRDVLCTFSFLMCVLSLGLLVCGSAKLAVGLLFLLSYMLQMVSQPLTSTLSYEFINRGKTMNFGLARGLGSVSFAVASMIIGNLLDENGTIVLPIASAIFFLIFLIANYQMKIPNDPINGTEADDSTGQIAGKAHSNLLDFAKYYKRFTFVLIAVVLLFFAHNIINDFMIQIITRIGGDNTTLGNGLSLAAVVELPAMALFDKMRKKVNCGTLLKLSMICFSLKAIVTMLAWNTVVYYISMSMQSISYALFIPAVIYYVNQKMDELDLAKGQAFVTGAITLGGVFGTIIGGQIIDHISVMAMLIVSAVVSIVGTIIGIVFVEKVVDVR